MQHPPWWPVTHGPPPCYFVSAAADAVLLCHQAGKKHYCINGRVLKKGKAAVDEECETLLKDGCCPYHGKGKENLISHHSVGVSAGWSACLPPSSPDFQPSLSPPAAFHASPPPIPLTHTYPGA